MSLRLSKQHRNPAASRAEKLPDLCLWLNGPLEQYLGADKIALQKQNQCSHPHMNRKCAESDISLDLCLNHHQQTTHSSCTGQNGGPYRQTEPEAQLTTPPGGGFRFPPLLVSAAPRSDTGTARHPAAAAKIERLDRSPTALPLRRTSPPIIHAKSLAQLRCGIVVSHLTPDMGALREYPKCSVFGPWPCL